jgi:hypothetical protein
VHPLSAPARASIPVGAAAHLAAEPLQQIQARFDTGSEEAHGITVRLPYVGPRASTTPLAAGTTNTTESNTAGTSKGRRFHQMNSLVTSYGIGWSELPGAIDEQFCGAGRPAKRCLIQAIEFGSQIGRLQTWLSASYCS